jgi:type IX secretion system PorP/SprF family membrane protein
MLLCTPASAQQRPHYTQYVLNNYVINPALSGIENYWDVRMSHRRQWVGLEGAPVTTYVTAHGPLKRDDYERRNALSGPDVVNPRGSAYWQTYTAAEPHHGIGFNFVSDKTGALIRTSFQGTYAYHLGLSSTVNLSMGLGVGIQRITLNTNLVDFGAISPIDPSIQGTGYLNKNMLDVNAGLWLYGPQFFGGIAVQNIVPNKVAFAENALKTENGRLLPHIFTTLGYRWQIDDDFATIPSMQARYIAPLPLSIDFNNKLMYKERVWLAGSYRTSNGFSLYSGFYIDNKFSVSYGYDFTRTAINTVSRGTHEIIIGILIGNNYEEWCPRRNW